MGEYLKTRWARQRFRTYGGKKKVLSKFFNKIENDQPKGKITTIAYGSAKFAPGGKGEIAVPTSSVYKQCCYRFPGRVYPVDYVIQEKIEITIKRHLQKTKTNKTMTNSPQAIVDEKVRWLFARQKDLVLESPELGSEDVLTQMCWDEFKSHFKETPSIDVWNAFTGTNGESWRFYMGISID